MTAKMAVVAAVTLALFLLATSVVVAYEDFARSYRGWRVIRLSPSVLQEAVLMAELEAVGVGTGEGEVWRHTRDPLPRWDVMLSPRAQRRLAPFLNAARIPASVILNDLDKTIRRERADLTAGVAMRSAGAAPADESPVLSRYLRYEEVNDFLAKMAGKSEGRALVVTMARSSEGRDVKAIRISSGPAAGGKPKPVILIDAGIHAREWIAPAMALYIIQQLITNSTHTDLIKEVDWHIIPLLNPDGYEYTHTMDRMWRKTRSITQLPQCPGVDPNRNFDFHWGVIGVSWNPCREIFAGPVAFSEPETQGLRDYALTLKGRIKLYISIHSYGGIFIYPWGFSTEKPDDWQELHLAGELAANATMAAGIPRMLVGNCDETLGDVAAGGSDDWMKGVLGVKYSYTLEMPTPSFTTPAAHIARYVVPVFEGIRAMGLHISAEYGEGGPRANVEED